MNRMLWSAWRACALAASLCCISSFVAAETIGSVDWFQRDIGDGVTWNFYLFDSLYGQRQAISFIDADLSNPNVSTSFPYLASTRGKTSAIVPAQSATAVGAINGTFFDTSTGGGGHETYLRVGGVDIPQGAANTKGAWAINGGMTVDGSGNVAVVPKPGGGWTTDTTSVDVMVNGPLLTDGGTKQSASFTSIGSHCSARHPRTAVGVTAANHLILVAVDGRLDEAAGMTCEELAQLMLDLGCTDSTSLDGGGSTTMWAKGEPFSGVVSYPSDNGAFDHLGERSVANAIAVESTAAAVPQWDGRLNSIAFDALTRSGDAYTVTANYTNLGSQTWTTSNVSVITSRAFSRASDFIPAGQEATFYQMVPASVPMGASATVTLNLTAPDVVGDTVYSEHFALSSTAVGYFGPADNELGFQATVRPELTGAPPLLIVQGGTSGVNNQWYDEPSGSWANSSVSFTVTGVTNGGTQRYVGATSTGRSARFRPIFDADGVYRVDVAFPSSSNSITARYTVTDQNGSSTFDLNQNSTAGFTNQWIELGEFEFTTANSGGFGAWSVEVGNPTTTGNRFYSGAVRFDYVAPLVTAVDNWQLWE